jgi:hypothetical protein
VTVCSSVFYFANNGFNSLNCVLCIGVFAECYTEEEHKKFVRQNVFQLLDLGAFNAVAQLLSIEIE